MAATSFRVMRAKDNTSGGISEAFTEAARSTRPGLFGPINPPMVLIPGGDYEGGLKRGRPQAAVTAAVAKRSRAAVLPKAWNPSYVVVGGCATTYGMTLLDPGGERIEISPYAFAAAIRDGEVFCTINHDPHLRIASRLDGSLRLFETSAGLHFELNPFASVDARRLDVLGRARRGEFIGASLRYGPEWAATRNAKGARVMSRANYLIEVSLVSRSCMPVDRRTWVSCGQSGQLRPATMRHVRAMSA